MIGRIQTAVIAGLAFAAGAASGGAALYVKGRIDGWARAEAAQDRATIEAMTAAQTAFLADLRKNQDDGLAVETITRDLGRAITGVRDDLANIRDGIVCPVDPRRARLLDEAGRAANAAIAAAGGQSDGAAATNSDAAAGGGPDE